MFLHNDKELFQEVIVSAAEDLDLVVPIVEKDYYPIDGYVSEGRLIQGVKMEVSLGNDKFE